MTAMSESMMDRAIEEEEKEEVLIPDTAAQE